MEAMQHVTPLRPTVPTPPHTPPPSFSARSAMLSPFNAIPTSTQTLSSTTTATNTLKPRTKSPSASPLPQGLSPSSQDNSFQRRRSTSDSLIAFLPSSPPNSGGPSLTKGNNGAPNISSAVLEGEEVSMAAFLDAMEEAPDWLLLDAFAMHVPSVRSDRFPDLIAAPPVPAHLLTSNGPVVPLPQVYELAGVGELLDNIVGKNQSLSDREGTIGPGDSKDVSDSTSLASGTVSGLTSSGLTATGSSSVIEETPEEEFNEDPIAFWEVRNAVINNKTGSWGGAVGRTTSSGSTGPTSRPLLSHASAHNRFGMTTAGATPQASFGQAVDELETASLTDEDGGRLNGKEPNDSTTSSLYRGAPTSSYTYTTSSGSQVTVSHTYGRQRNSTYLPADAVADITIEPGTSSLYRPRVAQAASPTSPKGIVSLKSASLNYTTTHDAITVAQRLRSIKLYYSVGHQRAIRAVTIVSADESQVLSSAGDGVTLLRQLPNLRTPRPNALPVRPVMWSAYTNSPYFRDNFNITMPTERLEKAVMTVAPKYFDPSSCIISGTSIVVGESESLLAVARPVGSVRSTIITPSISSRSANSKSTISSSFSHPNTSYGTGGAGNSIGTFSQSAYPTFVFDPFIRDFNPPESLTAGCLGASSVDALLGFTNQEGLVLHVSISSDFKLLATGSSDGLLSFFELATMKRLTVCQHLKPVRCSAFSKNAKYAISGCVDGSCRLWPTKRNQTNPVSTYFGHRSCVVTVAFQTTQGDYAVSGSEDGQVHLWNAASGTTIKVIAQHRSVVLAATFLHLEVQLPTTSASPEDPSSDGLGESMIATHVEGEMDAPKIRKQEINFVLSACASYISLTELRPNPFSATVDTIVAIRFDVADMLARERLASARVPTTKMHSLRSNPLNKANPTISCVLPAPQGLMPMCFYVCRSDSTISLFQFEVDIPALAVNPNNHSTPVKISNEIWSERARAPIICGATGPLCSIALGDSNGNVLRLSADIRVQK